MIRLDDFERIVFFTGAGLSSECGIPTYRGSGGVWSEYRHEEYACQQAFEQDPERVWDFHDMRRERVGEAEPGTAHRIIAEVQRKRPRTRIVTQNVDGLHQASGADGVIELHGSLWRLRCDECGRHEENRERPLGSRRCPCGSPWRPDIVWFGDVLDAATVQRACEAIASCDLLVSIGTSAVVFPAAELPRLAVGAGATRVEINPEETPASPLYQHHLRGSASEMLARIAASRGTAR